MPGARTDARRKREQMVREQIEARGIQDPNVLRAVLEVPREAFLPDDVKQYAYLDVALPIAARQTMSQPYIVALMASALELSPTDRVLEVGTGSGYAAAVLSRLAAEVFTIERHEELAEYAAQRLAELGYTNVHVRHGDGTLGRPEAAPFDAISVAAGGPEVPGSLLEQLRTGGRLVMPVGRETDEQSLVRVVRTGEHEYRQEEDLGYVRFVPLIGAQGWQSGDDGEEGTPEYSSGTGEVSILTPVAKISKMIKEACLPIEGINEASLDELAARADGCRVVLIGEATHGTSEFYRMRQRITRELVEKHGFTIVAAEADWPDAARIDEFVRERPGGPRRAIEAFSRFPLWMWRNLEVLEFVEWLREHNARQPQEKKIGFYGLDLYSLYTSIDEVLHYLDRIDPETARMARARYACLTPFERDPALYGHAALTGQYQTCEEDVLRMLRDLLAKRMEYISEGEEQFFDAAQNALVAANAEHYYRAMYYGSANSWNLRDEHMFDTLLSLLKFRGPDSKAVVWAHNSHVGNAAATEMAARGEHNIGQLAREKFGDAAYLIGFGTDHGTVAAASNWGEEVQIMKVRPSHSDSYERLFHETGLKACMLSLRGDGNDRLRNELIEPRLERAIGVIYRPDTELLSHYFQVHLPLQFDEYIWFDETRAVTPLGRPHAPALPQTHPFALLDE